MKPAPHLVDIYLHGPLGERFGEHHRMAVSTPQEAVRALDANYAGFLPAFAEHARYGLYADGDWREGEDAGELPFSRELHICPVIEGRAFIGPALVGALIPSLAGTLTAQIIGTVIMTALLIGISLLFAKKPKKEDEDKDDSFAFTGPENTTGQGVVVPLVYGRVYAGSVVVSAGFETTQLGTIQA